MEGEPSLRSDSFIRRSIMKGGQRRVSCVTFGENSVREIERHEETCEVDDKENKASENISKDTVNDGEEKGEDEPMPNPRRWTDSLKIRRKKFKDEDSKHVVEELEECLKKI